MTWPPEQRERPADVSWTLQIQHAPGGWWSNHTANLFPREQAEAFKAEQQAAYPKQRYRLVRVTTSYAIEDPAVGA